MRGVRTPIDSRWQNAIDLFEAGQAAAGYELSTVATRVRRLRSFVEEIDCGPWQLTWEAYRTRLDRLPVSKATRLTYRTALRSFYRWAVKTGRTREDPTDEPSLRAEILLASPAWEMELAGYQRHLRAVGRPETTVKVRVGQMRQFAREHSRLGPWDVTADDLLDWLGGKRIKPETRKGLCSAFRSFYAWARDTGRVKKNPAKKLPAVRLGQPEARPAKDEDYRLALAKAERWERLALRLAAEAGMRCAEVCAVHRRDVQGPAGDRWLLVHGKGNKERRVPISDDLFGAIFAAGDGWVFPGNYDGHRSPASMSIRISRLLPEGVTMHMLRHRFATRAYNVDRDVFTLQAVLGHARPTTTMRYVQVNESSKRRLIELANA